MEVKNPNLHKLDNTAFSRSYKAFMKDLYNAMTLTTHNPGNDVLKQNDAVWDYDGELNTDEVDTKVYFILEGKYRVRQMMFIREYEHEDVGLELALLAEQKDPSI